MNKNRLKAFADLANLEENDRILVIGKNAMAGQRVGFVVEDDEKANRYVEKLTDQFEVEVASKGPGPIKGTVLVVVIKKETIQ